MGIVIRAKRMPEIQALVPDGLGWVGINVYMYVFMYLSLSLAIFQADWNHYKVRLALNLCFSC